MSMPVVRFEALIERHHDEIYRYLWRLLSSAGWSDSADEAQDLTQEVFLRAYGAFGRLRRGSNHRAWLYKIASNCAYTALGRDKRQAMRNEPLSDAIHQIAADPVDSPDCKAMLDETLEKTRQCVAELPPKQGAAVVLRYVQGLSYAEIAQALDCSQDSARANVYQGLRRLRQELGEEFQHPKAIDNAFPPTNG
jgi:RNA polymerase sigma-70 factor (ECF subfamily)